MPCKDIGLFIEGSSEEGTPNEATKAAYDTFKAFTDEDPQRANVDLSLCEGSGDVVANISKVSVSCRTALPFDIVKFCRVTFRREASNLSSECRI